MSPFFVPRYFAAAELFPNSLVERIGNRAFALIDKRVLMALDSLREAWGEPIVINSGLNQDCGFRCLQSSVGATKSHHKPLYDDQAFDLHLGRGPINNARLWDWVLANGHRFHVRRIEDIEATPSWVHVEIGPAPVDSVKVFKP